METKETESTNCPARKNKHKRKESLEGAEKHLKAKAPKNTKASRHKDFV